MADRDYILQKVKETVHSFDRNAGILFYGSRARGAASSGSDWDFLILTEKEHSYQDKREIRKAVHLIEIETGEIISIIIHSKSYWNRPQNCITPFYKNVNSESIQI